MDSLNNKDIEKYLNAQSISGQYVLKTVALDKRKVMNLVLHAPDEEGVVSVRGVE